MKRKWKFFGIYLFLTVLAIICLLPFIIMLLNATQNNADLATTLKLLPGTNGVENYKAMTGQIAFWTHIKNSLIMTIPNVLLSAYLGTMAAYGFEKFYFKGKKALFILCMLLMVIPTQVSLIGLYQVYRKLKILNTSWTIILPGIANIVTVYWMRGNIYQIVDDALLEAATIDGCSQIQIFHQIVLPLCKSGIMTISIMNFVSVWNNYIDPVTYITTNSKQPISVAIAMMKSFDRVDFGAIYMAIALSTAVILIFYLIFNSQIMGGVTEGGIKG